MNLELRHSFPFSPNQFWELFWSPEFDQRMSSAETLRTVLEEKEMNGNRFARVRIEQIKPLPAAMAKLIGTDKLRYEQVSEFNLEKNIFQWRVQSLILPDKVQAHGTMQVIETKNGCERIVSGTIEVRIFLVGGKVEQAIVDELKKGYEDAANVLNSLFAERSRGTA